jgi:hypothetical protein
MMKGQSNFYGLGLTMWRDQRGINVSVCALCRLIDFTIPFFRRK